MVLSCRENFQCSKCNLKVWAETCCTIIDDGWTDRLKWTLINCLVYCPKGTMFIKSVDASDASKIRELLYGIFREVVLEIGPQYIVQFVTDNTANYVVACKISKQEF